MIFPNNGALFHGQGDEFRNFIERLEQEDCSSLEEALCTWASLRMQTLWRTVDGICGAYANALETWNFSVCHGGKDHEKGHWNWGYHGPT